jgi:hypothetical protein
MLRPTTDGARLVIGNRGSGEIIPGWSLALIGNASEQTLGVEGISTRGVFDKETRKKPLAFAADAVRADDRAAVIPRKNRRV